MERLDVFLVKKGICKSRENAKQAILNLSFTDKEGKILNKPSLLVDDDFQIILVKELNPYVSRGGYKLEKALSYFNLDIKDQTMLDIGASTGGFSSCALLNGIKKIYCVDVGHDQLDKSLKENEKIINLEGTDFKKMDLSMIKDQIDFATIDVSFTSVTLMFPNLKKILKGKAVILVKPQFECGQSFANKNGLVKSKEAHIFALNKVIEKAKENQLKPIDLTYSPIRGEKSGNIEYLLLLINEDGSNTINYTSVVEEAFKVL